MKAKKHLGQHFLTSQKALFDIVNAANIHKDDLVLEIGPGKGVLTERLLSLAGKVIAIEKDAELVLLLKEKFSKEIEDKKLIILQKDILLFDPSILKEYKKPYKIIANIPYYITGAIIEQFLSNTNQPSSMALLIQKEVADRIIARDVKTGNLGGKQSVLSIAVSAYGVPKIIAKVPPGAFFPPPKVDSAVISIENISRDFFKELDPPRVGGLLRTEADEKLFFEIVKSCFGKKRKQILGSLADFLENKDKAKSILQKADIPEKARPEDLTKENWKDLTRLVSS